MSFGGGSGGSGSISGSTDVALSNPGNGQSLVYNSTLGKWQNQTVSGTAADASPSAKGVIQLAGDLTGTAAVPVVAAAAITGAKIASGTITDSNISSSAAISKSKLAGLSITDSDVSAISESKITNLTTDLAAKANINSLAAVATSGSYADLANKPAIPAAGTTSGTYAAGNDSRIVRSAQYQTATQFPAASGTITLDCSVGYVWYGTVTGNFGFNLTNLPPSGTLAEIEIKVIQDGSGGHTLTGWQVNGSAIAPNWDQPLPPTVDTTVNASSILVVQTVDGGGTLDGQGTPQNVSQLIAGSNISITGGDGNGHGSLTIAYSGSSGGGYTVATSQPAALGTSTIGSDTTHYAAADHVHGRPMLLPSDLGFAAWSDDPRLYVNASSITSGHLQLVKAVMSAGTAITNVVVNIGTAGSGLTANQNFVAVYSATGTQLGVSASGSCDTLFTQTGYVTCPLSAATVSLAAGTIIYLAILSNGTPPTIARQSSLNFNTAFGGQYNGSLTTMPSSFTPSNLVSGTGYYFWLGAS